MAAVAVEVAQTTNDVNQMKLRLGTMEYFNMEITQELSRMSKISHYCNTQIPNASKGPDVILANADDSIRRESAPVDQSDDQQ